MWNDRILQLIRFHLLLSCFHFFQSLAKFYIAIFARWTCPSVLSACAHRNVAAVPRSPYSFRLNRRPMLRHALICKQCPSDCSHLRACRRGWRFMKLRTIILDIYAIATRRRDCSPQEGHFNAKHKWIYNFACKNTFQIGKKWIKKERCTSGHRIRPNFVSILGKFNKTTEMLLSNVLRRLEYHGCTILFEHRSENGVPQGSPRDQSTFFWVRTTIKAFKLYIIKNCNRVANVGYQESVVPHYTTLGPVLFWFLAYVIQPISSF